KPMQSESVQQVAQFDTKKAPARMASEPVNLLRCRNGTKRCSILLLRCLFAGSAEAGCRDQQSCDGRGQGGVLVHAPAEIARRIHVEAVEQETERSVDAEVGGEEKSGPADSAVQAIKHDGECKQEQRLDQPKVIACAA